ncbi:uncharacterized protein PG998_010653 [Apiospora kogelbergensis]|uniref:uncharacterized protein n=1 Tax=Apiospora kogelbergensis TaxID=1337665 RepID=UPI00312D3C8C
MARPRFEGLWSKWLLLPCWMVQMGASIIFVIAGAILLIGAEYTEQMGNDSFNGYSMKDLAQLVRINGAIILSFSIMTFLFCIVEIVLHATRILNPVVVLVFACLKALGWLVMVILNIITTAQGAAFPLAQLHPLFFGAKYTHHSRLAASDRGRYEKTDAAGAEAGFQHTGNYTQVSGPGSHPHRQNTAYRSPSPESIIEHGTFVPAPLYSHRGAAGTEPQRPAQYY